MVRENYEAEVIGRFEAVAKRLGLMSFKGQRAENRVAADGNIYFQFGDLRIDFPQFHLLVEVESAGGVTNLVKYWKCLVEGSITRPVRLIHVFRQKSANDYGIHIDLWHFLNTRMSVELPDSFRACLFKFDPEQDGGLDAAVSLFTEWIQEGQAQQKRGHLNDGPRSPVANPYESGKGRHR